MLLTKGKKSKMIITCGAFSFDLLDCTQSSYSKSAWGQRQNTNAKYLCYQSIKSIY